jgi:hypothetical protein
MNILLRRTTSRGAKTAGPHPHLNQTNVQTVTDCLKLSNTGKVLNDQKRVQGLARENVRGRKEPQAGNCTSR